MPLLPILILFLFALSSAEEQSDADKRKELLGAAQVSRVHSIDEAKGTYKSPRKAMFMSLVLPGSGQLYVGSKQSRYVRGIFYLAEEIALISGLYYHTIYKYDKKVKNYQNFAKEHFSVGRYEEEMGKILRPDEETFQKLYRDPVKDSYCKAFYGSSDNCPKPNDNTKLYNSREYYRVIADEHLILGWDDVASNVYNAQNYLYEIYLSDETPVAISLGASKNRDEYASMRKKANDLADRQVIFLGALFLNHIISAIDAALAAKARNNSLYEEKISFLDKIRLESDLNLSESFRVGAGLWYYF
jgi:hypothetical protein